MSEYAKICMNMLKSAQTAFALHFAILYVVISCQLERLITYSNVNTKLEDVV